MSKDNDRKSLFGVKDIPSVFVLDANSTEDKKPIIVNPDVKGFRVTAEYCQSIIDNGRNMTIGELKLAFGASFKLSRLTQLPLCYSLFLQKKDKGATLRELSDGLASVYGKSQIGTFVKVGEAISEKDVNAINKWLTPTKKASKKPAEKPAEKPDTDTKDAETPTPTDDEKGVDFQKLYLEYRKKYEDVKEAFDKLSTEKQNLLAKVFMLEADNATLKSELDKATVRVGAMSDKLDEKAKKAYAKAGIEVAA